MFEIPDYKPPEHYLKVSIENAIIERSKENENGDTVITFDDYKNLVAELLDIAVTFAMDPKLYGRD